MGRKKFLIELGVEEIPPGTGANVVVQLREKLSYRMQERRVPEVKIDCAYTPSRIVIWGTLPALSLSQEKLIPGPSYEVAFKNGKPTPAYFGFLRSQEAEEKDVIIQETRKGRYIFVKKIEPAVPVSEILTEVFPQVFDEISLPTYMVWDDSGLRFIRPLRWLLALSEDGLLRLKLGKLNSRPYTFIRQGGEFKKYKINSIKDYFQVMRNANIILSPDNRRKRIRHLLNARANSVNLSLYPSWELLSEVNDLVERPSVVSCSFESQFLELPGVVLLASMAKYQRVFALVDNSGNIHNNFLAVVEGSPGNINMVKRHYEFVLNSRLWDASYFIKEDRKQSLPDRVPMLNTILHHQKLGTVLDKVNAMVRISRKLGRILKLGSQEIENLTRAAYLCKADLLTRMVYEFPSLEGIMGGIYARWEGEKEEVATAISDHYKPRTNEDSLPSTKLSALLSLVDKLYNVIGFLGLGLIPSGSEDPFTIRRQIQAIVRIWIQYQLEANVEELFEICYQELKPNLSENRAQLLKLFVNLVKERFEVLMREEEIPRDLLSGVVKVNFHNPAEVYLRIRKLLRIYNSSEFYMASKVVERTANIIKGENWEGKKLDVNLLSLPEEKKLWKLYSGVKEKIQTEIAVRNYDNVLVLYAKAFYDIIHLFFDKVLVNVQDEEIRNNRKVLLYLINRLVTERVADLKEMEVLKDARG